MSIAADVKAILDDYGVSIDVLKFTTTGSPNRYNQGAQTYASAVSVQAHVELHPTRDMVTPFGDDVLPDAMVTLGRSHLETAFSPAAAQDAIRRDDEVGFNGKRWKVESVHATGWTEDGPEVVVLLLSAIKGRETEVYP